MQTNILVVIPTCDRPEYLSCLLSSLIYQDYRSFDVLIADSGKNLLADRHPMVTRFVDTLRGTGHDVTIRRVPVVGKSEAAAVNYLLVEAARGDYSFLYKIDDDHIIPPFALSRLTKTWEELSEKYGQNIILSGLTPWMHAAWEGATDPSDPPRDSTYLDNGLLTRIEKDRNGDLKIEPNHFFRYKLSCLKETQLASAANFFMSPDIRLLWSDLGPSSLYADAVWFLQLRKFLGYRMWFDLSLEVWHSAAPHGGVRELADDFGKQSSWDLARLYWLEEFEKGISNEG